MANFTIFISHKVGRDQKTAEALKTILTRPFDRTDVLAVHISEKIVPGHGWKHKIYRWLHESNLLLLLFTDPTLDWNWCLYEAGLFTDLNKLNESQDHEPKIVCIYPPGKEAPRPLEHIQGVEGTQRGVQDFLRKLYKSEDYGCENTLATGATSNR